MSLGGWSSKLSPRGIFHRPKLGPNLTTTDWRPSWLSIPMHHSSHLKLLSPIPYPGKESPDQAAGNMREKHPKRDTNPLLQICALSTWHALLRRNSRNTGRMDSRGMACHLTVSLWTYAAYISAIREHAHKDGSIGPSKRKEPLLIWLLKPAPVHLNRKKIIF